MAAFEGVTDVRYDTSDQDRALKVSLASWTIRTRAHQSPEFVSAIPEGCPQNCFQQEIPCFQ